MKAWHCKHTGALHIAIGRWFKLTVFAAPPSPDINDGKPGIEMSLRICRWYRVFHWNTTHPQGTC